MPRRNNYCCCNELKAVSVEVTATTMQVTFVPLQSYAEDKFYLLALCPALPARIGTEPVSINDGVNSYPAIDTNGQPVVSGQMRGHRKYLIRFGAGGALSSGTIPPHFTIYEGLCPMEYTSNAALQAAGQEG